MTTLAEHAPEQEELPAEPVPAGGRAPLLALAAIVTAGFALYALLGLLVDVPRVHPDEVRYVTAASSLLEGEGLTLRGGEYGFGPLIALFYAAILWPIGSVDEAYAWFKVANALVFALTAVPVYLLARRVVSAWWAVLAAGLAIAIPSSISVGTVMTESLSYLAAGLAMYAIALTLERPTLARQLAALTAIAAAFLARSQFGVLYVSLLLGLALVWWIVPARRPRSLRDLRPLWPLTLPVLLALAVLGGRAVTGSSPSESLGAYWELWRGYDPLEVAKWIAYHLADFEIYLAVVPLAVAPIVLAVLIRAGRSGSERAASFASLYLAANATGFLVVGAFNSTPYAYDRLHDRYAFYLLPLWLVGLVVWLAGGLPRPLVATATGVVLALALPAILPFRQLANEAGIDTVPGALWLRIESGLSGPGPASGRIALALFVAGLLAATVLLPRRARIAIPAAVLAVFAAMSFFAWERILDAPEDRVFAGGLERAWIDERLPSDTRVAKVYIESPRCPTSTLTRHALFLTEFFNRTVDRAYYIGDSIPDGIPLPRVDVAPSGVLELETGAPLEEEHVYAPAGLAIDGERVAEGTAASLVLWRVDGPVRVVGATSNDEVRTADCAR